MRIYIHQHHFQHFPRAGLEIHQETKEFTHVVPAWEQKDLYKINGKLVVATTTIRPEETKTYEYVYEYVEVETMQQLVDVLKQIGWEWGVQLDTDSNGPEKEMLMFENIYEIGQGG